MHCIQSLPKFANNYPSGHSTFKSRQVLSFSYWSMFLSTLPLPEWKTFRPFLSWEERVIYQPLGQRRYNICLENWLGYPDKPWYGNFRSWRRFFILSTSTQKVLFPRKDVLLLLFWRACLNAPLVTSWLPAPGPWPPVEASRISRIGCLGQLSGSNSFIISASFAPRLCSKTLTSDSKAVGKGSL